MTQLEQKLKNKKLRLTTSRKVIFDILNNSDRAMSPQDVCAQLDDSMDTTTDQASVYRNLLLFSQIGLTHRLESGKYTVCQHEHGDEDEHQHTHVHIMANCTQCGKTYELEKHEANICKLANDIIYFIKGFDSFSGITLSGKCSSCL